MSQLRKKQNLWCVSLLVCAIYISDHHLICPSIFAILQPWPRLSTKLLIHSIKAVLKLCLIADSFMHLLLRSMEVNSINRQIYRDSLTRFNNRCCWSLWLWTPRFIPASEHNVRMAKTLHYRRTYVGTGHNYYDPGIRLWDLRSCCKVRGLDGEGYTNWRCPACWSPR